MSTQLAPPTGMYTAEPMQPADVPERRRQVRGARDTDVYAAVGAAVSAVSLSALLFTAITPWDGLLGFVFVAYVFFLAIYGFLVSFDESGPAVRDTTGRRRCAQFGVPVAHRTRGRRGLHHVARCIGAIAI